MFSSFFLAMALAQDPATDLEAMRGVLRTVEPFADVQVEHVEGVVRLTGSVPSVVARNQVEALAEKVPHTLFVDNLLTIDDEALDDERAGDATNEELLRQVFAQIPDLADVSVTVQSGVVRLEGSVLDKESREKATSLAEGRSGVLYVDDQMQLNTNLDDRVSPALDEAWAQIQTLIAKVPLFLLATLIMVAAWVLSGVLTRWEWLFRGVSGRPLLRATLSRVVRIVVLGIGTLIALELLDATALVGAVVGTAGVFGLALGFAFQDIVENYLAGMLLSIQQPFSKDDFIDVDGTKGMVIRLTARNTLLLTADGNHVYMPNASVFKAHVINYNRNPRRRFDFTVGVGVEENLSEVMDVGRETLLAMPGVVDEPAPVIRIEELGDSSVVMHVFAWVDQRNHSFLAVRTEAIRRIKDAYDCAGFDMPEPIYRVSVLQPSTKPTPERTPPVHDDQATEAELGPDVDLLWQAREQRNNEPGADLLA